MTKLISIFAVILVVFVGYRLFVYWERVDNEEDLRAAEAAQARNVDPNALPGVPWEILEAYQAANTKAKTDGGESLRRWLKTNRRQCADPRLAWIELDFVEVIARSSPNEARQVFRSVQERTPTNSALYPRVLQLKKAFE